MAEETLRDTISRVVSTEPEDTSATDAVAPVEVDAAAPADTPAKLDAPAPETPEDKAPDTPDAKVPKEDKDAKGLDEKAEAAKAAVKTPKIKVEAAKGIRAPESWKPAIREQHWSKLPVAVQTEIHRRERQVDAALQESSEARKTSEALNGLVTTYKDVFEYEKAPPLQTVSNLLNISRSLRFSPAPQKAQLMAQVIQGFGIDVKLLDQALSMLVSPQDPAVQQVNTQTKAIQDAIAQQLAPVREFMGGIQKTQQSQAQKAEQDMQSEVSAFANDPKNEYFEVVKDVMADIMEVGARHGQKISLQDAYRRAILANNDLAVPYTQAMLKAASASASAPADQAARRAGLSVTGAPGGGLAVEGGVNLRGDIEAAVARHSGR
jgi:hypothetical protein